MLLSRVGSQSSIAGTAIGGSTPVTDYAVSYDIPPWVGSSPYTSYKNSKTVSVIDNDTITMSVIETFAGITPSSGSPSLPSIMQTDLNLNRTLLKSINLGMQNLLKHNNNYYAISVNSPGPMVLVKFDIDFNLVWAKQFTISGYPYSFVPTYSNFLIDSSENIYLCCQLVDNNYPTPTDKYSVVVMKINSSGTLLSSTNLNTTLTSTTDVDRVQNVFFDSNGNINICGADSYSINGIVICLDTSLNILWTVGLDTSQNCFALGGGTDGTSSYVVVGVVGSTPYIAKINPNNGSVIWQKSLPTTISYGYLNLVCYGSRIFLHGSYKSSGTGSVNQPWYAEINSSGTILWSQVVTFVSNSFNGTLITSSVTNLMLNDNKIYITFDEGLIQFGYVGNNPSTPYQYPRGSLLMKLPDDGTIRGTGSYNIVGLNFTISSLPISTSTNALTVITPTVSVSSLSITTSTVTSSYTVTSTTFDNYFKKYI